MNKQELKEKINDLTLTYYVPKEAAINLIDQLDEPEKVVIPQFVAKYIESIKDSAWGNITDLFEDAEDELGVWWFGQEHFDMLARAWLDGYTVEEKKYHVLDKKGCVLLKKYISGASLIMTTGIKPERFPEWQQGDLMLTEQEIKDYDPRYWAFAVPVEEEEE